MRLDQLNNYAAPFAHIMRWIWMMFYSWGVVSVWWMTEKGTNKFKPGNDKGFFLVVLNGGITFGVFFFRCWKAPWSIRRNEEWCCFGKPLFRPTRALPFNEFSVAQRGGSFFSRFTVNKLAELNFSLFWHDLCFRPKVNNLIANFSIILSKVVQSIDEHFLSLSFSFRSYQFLT